MKKLFFFLGLLLPITLSAQNFTNLNFKQAADKAKAEKKIILVDVSRPGPNSDAKTKCENEVTALPGMKNLLENNVVAIRIDMSTEAGKEFAPLLQMNMYPTYAFLMADGDLLNVVSPYSVQKDISKFSEAFDAAIQMAKTKWSNSREIIFTEMTLDDVLKKAQKENKMVFVDAITESCQPCMKMLKNVFTLDSVADFYNANFLNIRVDFTKDMKEMTEKYQIEGFPTYLFLDGTGKLIYKNSGYTPAKEFIGFGKTALEKFKSSEGINFEHLTWSEVLQKAKNENKPIFVDCFTVWCGPCKVMANEVFTQKMIGDYFNKNYVSTKVDMEKGEGIDLKKKFQISAYPTFLYLDKDGNEIFRIVGSMPADAFLKQSINGVKEGGLSGYREKYKNGERGEKFISDYIGALESAYFMKEASSVATEFLNSVSANILENQNYWIWFVKYVQDIDSPVFKKVASEKEKFVQKFGNKVYDQKMFLAWSEASRHYVVKNDDNTVSFDKVGFETFLKRLKAADVSDSNLIVVNAKMFNAEIQGNWSDYVNLANDRIKKDGIESVPVIEIYNWCLKIDQKCNDLKLRHIALEWVKKVVPIIEEQEAKRLEATKKSGMMPAMSMINFNQAFAKLSESLSK